MRFSTLQQWLFWLDTQQVTCSAPQAFEQMRSIVQRLNLASPRYPVITVTGTNGKGSCVALLKSIYMAAGYQVGTFTSPHLFRFNERICFQDQCIDDILLCEFFEKIDQARDAVTLSYFHFSFLAALLWFQSLKLDVVILEVGIGGRYDPTNIIDADLSIITSIDLDHCERLGYTREAISLEKAGIFRPHRPAICGDRHPPQALLNYVQSMDIPFYYRGKDFDEMSLMVIEKLSHKLSVKKEHIQTGMKQSALPWRCQLVEKDGVKYLLDVAHNPAAIRRLAEKIRDISVSGRVFAVCGMCKDKDLVQNMKPLVDRVDGWFLATLNNVRGASSKELGEILTQLQGKNIHCYDLVKTAFRSARDQLQKGDLLVVFGSFFMVSDVHF
ncbi:MAG: hypothetical protein A3C55_00970 [Gammaproteobacteria bacterium RIFCSPHIGHO2_02_FULL_42_13]|nr:MAG: hypothetical protein A3C55_00970 [Gammaproteobacteria bacterium RIFCSPHIGHO2_02_FULL_42_13]OGT69696.1 MAG: hypothetical protein A3H43_01265 [Gammaproteobacteria bacterium RIFCSPLOWO2_02_FULL_42_9]